MDQKQVLYLVKVGAAIFFDHPYIIAPIGATDAYIHTRDVLYIPVSSIPTSLSFVFISSRILMMSLGLTASFLLA